MVRIRCKLESEVLNLPELRPLVGKVVEITVVEELTITPGTGDWDAVRRAAESIRQSTYDFDAWRLQREADLTHTNHSAP